MTRIGVLDKINTIFVDTAPIIYFIEAHPQFGPLVKEVVNAVQSGKLRAFSSVLTLAEVLPKPIAAGDEKLAKTFAEFLKHGRNFSLVEISSNLAESAGKLRGQYSFLRTIDAVQFAVAIDLGVDAFLTNDKKLKRVKGIDVIVLNDYL
ncbi:MAG: PIN domain-containing protein [Proteobacteria bacterium]|nr:PIN domain-containing protein [Pseudomonadota bacterium]